MVDFGAIEFLITAHNENPILFFGAILLFIGYLGFLLYNFFVGREEREDLRHFFDNTAKGLFSEVLTERICSAILLRRFLNKKNKEGRGKNSYKMEAMNIISSLLKIEKCSEFQKTLADSLSYTDSMEEFDFQNCNFQNMCLKPNKSVLSGNNTFFKKYGLEKNKEIKINLNLADFFKADFSYATISDIHAKGTVFFKSNLHKSVIKNSDFIDTYFRESYCSEIIFRNCYFENADFGSSFLGKAKFQNCKLENCNFNAANMENATFINCTLSTATFHNTYLNGLDFINNSVDFLHTLKDLDFTQSHNLPHSFSKLPIECLKIASDTQELSKHLSISSSKKKIFLSCFGALSPKQVEFLNRLKFDLSKIDIEIVNFDRTKYRLTGQLSAIQTEMASCHGVIAVLFKDIVIKEGIYRPETEDMREITNYSLSSPWINIELGLAYGMRKEILMLHDGQIKDGLLDNEITDCIITKIDYLTYNYTDYDYEVRKWANNLEYFILPAPEKITPDKLVKQVN